MTRWQAKRKKRQLCRLFKSIHMNILTHTHTHTHETHTVYYHRPGWGDGANKWMLYYEGGGWCSNPEECYDRTLTELGSSNDYDKTKRKCVCVCVCVNICGFVYMCLCCRSIHFLKNHTLTHSLSLSQTHAHSPRVGHAHQQRRRQPQAPQLEHRLQQILLGRFLVGG